MSPITAPNSPLHRASKSLSLFIYINLINLFTELICLLACLLFLSGDEPFLLVVSMDRSGKQREPARGYMSISQ